MGDNLTLVYQILGALAIVVTLVFLVMSTRVWRWHTILFSLLVFAGSITFLVYAAAVHKTRSEWGELHKQKMEQLASLRDQRATLADGATVYWSDKDSRWVQVSQKDNASILKNNVKKLGAELTQVTAGRGLVWRHAKVEGQPGADNIATLTVVDAPVEGEKAEASGFTDASIGKKLFAFGESQVDVDGTPRMMPTDYLGEFMVDRITATSVTIKPVSKLTPTQITAIGRATDWALYETLPQDSHWVFKEIPNDPASDEKTENLFGQSMDTAKLESLASAVEINNVQISDEMIQKYVMDGAPIDKVSFEVSDSEKWVLLKFGAPYTAQVDKDAADGEIPAIEHGEITFNEEGLAALARLRQGEPTEFVVNDTLVIDKEGSDRLIADGANVEVVETYFVRDLRDFHGYIQDFHKQMDSLQTEVRQLNEDIANVSSSVTELEAQITVRSKEKDDLTFDVTGFTKERDILQNYLAQLTTQRDQLRQAISLAFRQNISLERQLAERQAEMADEINRRTKELTNN